MPTTVRRAGPIDAEALAHLRLAMFEALATPTSSGGAWLSGASEWFREHLADGRAAAFVAETESGALVAAALGQVRQDAPSPSNPDGVTGYVSNVVTAPDHQRRGHARECVQQLLAWFRDETAAATVDLFATGQGADLYESLGFRIGPHPTMRLQFDR